MVYAESLSVDFDGFTLNDIHLRVESGESFFLLGPSGAGKTLLLEALLGIRRPREGRVLIDGRVVTRLPPEERQVGYVPQDLALFPHLSVRDNVLFGLRARGKMPVDAPDRMRRWVELLDLGNVIDRPTVHTLSGGESQRVALARALVVEPRVLFMDEPFSALDLSLRRRLQAEFRDLQRRLGLTLVQVTHDPEEAFLMADRMAILMGGRIEQTGLPADLYNRPSSLRVARFLMLQNLFPARMGPRTEQGHQRVELADGRLRLDVEPSKEFADGARAMVGVRPEEVILVRPGVTPDPARYLNLFCGTVKGWVDLGHSRLVRLRVDSLELDAWLNIRAAREYPMAPGEEVWFHIRPWSFCVLPSED